MKTPMQQLLDRFREMGPNWYNLDEIEQEILDFGMHVEKQQIMQAWRARELNKWGTENTIYNAEEYYNETYGGNP